jgi:hypothetical protein
MMTVDVYYMVLARGSPSILPSPTLSGVSPCKAGLVVLASPSSRAAASPVVSRLLLLYMLLARTCSAVPVPSSLFEVMLSTFPMMCLPRLPR